MRTTLNLSDDIFYTSKTIAQRERRSIGEVLSDLARQGLTTQHLQAQPVQDTTPFQEHLASLGLVPYAAPQRKIVTDARVKQLREEEGV